MINHWLAGPSVFKPIWVTRFVVPKNGLQIEKHTKTVGNRGLYLYVVLFSIFGGGPGPDSMGATQKNRRYFHNQTWDEVFDEVVGKPPAYG